MHAESLDDPGQVGTACSLASPWEADCRQGWVRGQLEGRGAATDALLQVCAGAPDCVFTVLDARPSAALDQQVARCVADTGPYAVDCTRHALQRWVAGKPDADAVARAAALPWPDAQDAGRWLAVPVACHGVGACAGPDAVRAACEEGVRTLQAHPERCVVAAPEAGRPRPE